MCLQASRAVNVSAYNCQYLHMQRLERVSAFISLYQGDEHLFVFVGFYQELSIYLHLLVCIKSLECVCMCLHISRAERVSSYVGRYHVSACVSARIESHPCFSICLHVQRADQCWPVSRAERACKFLRLLRAQQAHMRKLKSQEGACKASCTPKRSFFHACSPTQNNNQACQETDTEETSAVHAFRNTYRHKSMIQASLSSHAEMRCLSCSHFKDNTDGRADIHGAFFAVINHSGRPDGTHKCLHTHTLSQKHLS